MRAYVNRIGKRKYQNKFGDEVPLSSSYLSLTKKEAKEYDGKVVPVNVHIKLVEKKKNDRK